MPATCTNHRTALERDGLKGAAQAAAKRTLEPGTLRIRSRRRGSFACPGCLTASAGLGAEPQEILIPADLWRPN